MAQIPINLAFEDSLSQALLTVIIGNCGNEFVIGKLYTEGGFGYLKRMAPAFNNAAKSMPYLILTDLDRWTCPTGLIKTWLPNDVHRNLIFRVAVREVESWLLADQAAFAKFLGIEKDFVPDNPDTLVDPKATLIELAAKSPKREIKRDIVPRHGSTSTIGPNYNGRLIVFVQKHWSMKIAMTKSPSLKRAVDALVNFRPTWPAE